MKKALTLFAAALLVTAAFQIEAAVTRASTGTPIGPFGAAATCLGTGSGDGGLTDTIVYTETGTITDVNVRVEVDHSFRADLVFHVEYSVGGGDIVLAEDHGSLDDDYYATFDDEGAGACSDGANCGAGGPCTGASAPGPTCMPDSSLTSFDGLASPGTWTMAMCDDAGGDSGTLVAWEMTVDGMMGDGLPVELVGFGIE